MGRRRKAREMALQVLYQIDVAKEECEEALRIFWAWARADEQVQHFCNTLVRGTMEHLDTIDAMLKRVSDHWSLERMSIVDRNILRFAIYELCYLDDIPPKVTINEAIEIAKTYGTADSAVFVNGILDRVKREVYGEEAEAPLLEKDNVS